LIKDKIEPAIGDAYSFERRRNTWHEFLSVFFNIARPLFDPVRKVFSLSFRRVQRLPSIGLTKTTLWFQGRGCGKEIEDRGSNV